MLKLADRDTFSSELYANVIVLRPRPQIGVRTEPHKDLPMTQRKSTARDPDVSSPIPETPPSALGHGHPEYHFVAGLMDVQKQLGEIKAEIQSLGRTVEDTRSKVEDLVAWKNRILGGAVGFGAVCAFLGFALTKLSNYITIKSPAPAVVTQPADPDRGVQVPANPR